MKFKLIISLGLLLALVIVIASTGLMAQNLAGKGEAASDRKAASGAKVAKPEQQVVPKVQAAPPKSTSPISGEEKTKAPSTHKVIVYYFHGQGRCPSCLKIEAYTKEAIQGRFADLLKAGRLEWRVINVEETGHEHYIKDYKLYTKSVVIADIHDGKQKEWKNLPKVWELLYNKDAFLNYIQDEINSYLKGI